MVAYKGPAEKSASSVCDSFLVFQSEPLYVPLKVQDVPADHSDMLKGGCESCEYIATKFGLFVSRIRDELVADLIFTSSLWKKNHIYEGHLCFSSLKEEINAPANKI